jgi:hypothetical protein
MTNAASSSRLFKSTALSHTIDFLIIHKNPSMLQTGVVMMTFWQQDVAARIAAAQEISFA